MNCLLLSFQLYYFNHVAIPIDIYLMKKREKLSVNYLYLQ